MPKLKITINLDPRELEDLDSMAADGGRTRSAEVAWLIRQTKLTTDLLGSGSDRPARMVETPDEPPKSGPKVKAMQEGDWGA